MVNLGGEWYHVDVAWNANEGDHFYFGMSTELISRDHVIEVAVPEAAANAYNYAMNKTDAVFGSVEELGDVLEAMPAHQAEFTFYYTGSDVIDAALTEWAQANAAEYGLTGLSCTSADYTRFISVSRVVNEAEEPEAPEQEEVVEIPQEQPEEEQTVVVDREALAFQSIAVNSTLVTPGQQIVWTCTATGGNGALSYNYVILKDSAIFRNEGWKDSNTFTFIPEE